MNKRRKDRGRKKRRKPLTWKGRLFLLAFGIALVGLLELTLRLTGLAPPYRTRDPLLEGGKVDRSYVRQTSASGEAVYVCQWIRPDYPYNFQPIPARKPEDEKRIFVFGGSSAVGYPFDGRLAFSQFLQTGLDAVVGEDRARVINVAQNSIPAGQCLRLMHEMAGYQPDAFVVYSGNNEYDDSHVYREVLKRGRFLTAIRSAVGHVAIYRGMERALLPVKARVYDRFEFSENVLRPPAYSEAERRAIRDNYEYVIRRMAGFCKQNGIELVLCGVAANEADWPPYRSEFRAALSEEEKKIWLQAFESLARRTLSSEPAPNDEILAGLGTLAEMDDGRADLHYLRGVVFSRSGKKQEAATSFQKALDLDGVCYRARPSHNEIVRRVARENGYPFLDVTATLRQHAETDLLGENFFWDHCHPKPEAHQAIAQGLAGALFDVGVLSATERDWKARFEKAASSWQEDLKMDARLQARAWRNVASGWLALWTHHRDETDSLRTAVAIRALARAKEFLDKAIETDPKLPGARFYRGVVFAQRGEQQRAMADWRLEMALGSQDGPHRAVLEGLLSGAIPPDRGFNSWLAVRNEMVR